jgi:nicotinamide-nucleotide amidase
MPGISCLDLAERLGQALTSAGLRMVCAESCTGGGLGFAVTSVPGSSRWFERGFIVYSNEAKTEDLEVPVEIVEQHGAVSEATARAMVQGALNRSHADISVAITGIAGPEGGTPEKPVGTVCLAWLRRGGEPQAVLVHLSGDRSAVREQAVLLAIQGLLERVATWS